MAPRAAAAVHLVSLLVAGVVAGVLGGGLPAAAQNAAGQPVGAAQPPDGARQLVIPSLANASKPSDLDFMGAECDVAAGGAEMTCRFLQVFLTTPTIDAAACVITTNGYERVFQRAPSDRWISRDAPTGACAIVDTATLEGDGRRWTLTFLRAPTADRPECRAIPTDTETYESSGSRRRLPCTFVQPGDLGR